MQSFLRVRGRRFTLQNSVYFSTSEFVSYSSSFRFSIQEPNVKLFFVLFLNTLALASEVTHTGVTLRHFLASQDVESPFEIGNYLCVVQNRDEIACGFVEKIEERGVLVDLEFRAEDIKVGSTVQRAATRRPCDPDFVYKTKLNDPYSRKCSDAEKAIAKKFRIPSTKFYSIGIGLGSPRLAGELAVMQMFSIGLSAELQSFYSSIPSIKATATGTAYGGTLFVGFYPYSIFENLFAQASFGYYIGRMNLRGDLNSWTGTMIGLRAGYRFLNWQGFGVGISASAQHFSFGNSEDPTRTEFLYPGFLVEFGGTF